MRQTILIKAGGCAERLPTLQNHNRRVDKLAHPPSHRKTPMHLKLIYESTMEVIT